MLRGLGSWLGLERAGEEKLLPAEERSSSEEEAAAADAESAAQSSEPAELQADSEALLSQAKGLGSECSARARRGEWGGGGPVPPASGHTRTRPAAPVPPCDPRVPAPLPRGTLGRGGEGGGSPPPPTHTRGGAGGLRAGRRLK